MKQYVFGYGSLIETVSRIGTVPNSGNAIAVKVQGLVRGWWARTKVTGFSTTYLGCLDVINDFVPDSNIEGWINGVLFAVNDEDLAMLDEREKNYRRTKINLNRIRPYGDFNVREMMVETTSVWVFLNVFENRADFDASLPDRQFPIVQSYVDTCLNGCLELETISPGFISDFITTTWGWRGAWANDRIFPRRPHVHCKNAFRIDELLKKYLPDSEIFDNIYIE